MTRTYPITKVTSKRLSYNVSGYRIPPSGMNGACALPIPIETTRYLDAVDQVTLGKSPNGWKDKIRKGISATSPLTGVQYIVKGGKGYFESWSTSPNFPANCYHGFLSGNFAAKIGTFPALNVVTSNLADQLARENLLGDYLRQRKAFRGGNFIAEFRDTVRMMKHPADSLYKGLTKFIRGVKSLRQIGSYQTYASRLSDMWLAWQFGWKPLFSDVREAAVALAKLEDSGRFDGRPIRGKGAETRLVNQGDSTASMSPIAGLGAKNTYWTKSTSEVAYSGLIKARPESFSTFADHFGVGVGDIIPAVWEAIPWSFLVDYFVNCNDVLESLQWCQQDIGFINRRLLNDVSNHYTWQKGTVQAGFDTRVAIDELSYHSIYKVRSVSGIPYPSLRFKMPKLGQSFNIGALWVSIFASKPKKLFGVQPGD